MSNHSVCVFSCREQWIHSVHCGTALLCKWKSVLKCVCVCARLCSDLWKWAFNTITSWAIINSLLKFWTSYPWKHVSAAIEVKQQLTLAVIEFWSCYCQRIHLIEKYFEHLRCCQAPLIFSLWSQHEIRTDTIYFY